MIDAVKIYGKTKEQFGWPDEPPEEFPSASVSNICPSNLNQSNGTGDSDSAAPTTTSGTVLERYRHLQERLRFFPFSIHGRTLLCLTRVSVCNHPKDSL